MTQPREKGEAAVGNTARASGQRLASLCFGPQGVDARLTAAIGVAFSILYGVLAWRLARGHFFEHYNLIFDYDSPAFADLIAPASSTSHIDSVARAIKHPLSPWLSIFYQPFRKFGIDRLDAAGFVNAAVGGATAALLFRFSRATGTPRPEAVLITLIFGMGAAHIFSSMMVESYAYAAFTLAIVWYIAARRIFDGKPWGPASIAAGVMVFGVTATNIVQVAIAELFAQWSRTGFRSALRNTVFAGAAIAALSAVAIALTWPEAVSYAIAHPGAAAREIYWQQTKGPKTGLAQILLTFFGFSLVAPHFDTLQLPEGILMRDFRSPSLSMTAIGGLLLWNALFFAGTFVAVHAKRTRVMACALLVAMFFNVALHMFVQFRGSLFIYTPHIWFTIAALTALGAAALQPSATQHHWGLRIALVLVLFAIAPVNLTRAVEAARLFDNPQMFTAPATPH